EFIASISGAGNGITYDMTFGFAANATDGFDVEIDLYAPPIPPPPSFDAALGWMSDRYYTQILAVDIGVEKIYDILLQYPEDDMITLSWDNSGWSSLGTFILQDAFDGAFLDEDMTQVNSITLTNPVFNVLKLKVTATGGSPEEDTDDLSLMDNWNLISFDIDIVNDDIEDVFAELISSSNLIYVTGYSEEGFIYFDPNGPSFLNTLLNIEPGDGYWIKLFEPDNIIQFGYQLSADYTIDLMESWNMIAYWLQENSIPEEAFGELIENDNLIYVTGYSEEGFVYFDPNGLEFLNTLTALE
ncbi:uncharacterized protein METZ01_LOCUS377715, partial [marine metagenome]